jgi:hypothetical protein
MSVCTPVHACAHAFACVHVGFCAAFTGLCLCVFVCMSSGLSDDA